MRSSIILVAGATLALAATAGNAATAAGPVMGSAKTTSRPAFQGYYDGHKDTYLNTDVSSKSDAAMMHVNYSAVLNSTLTSKLTNQLLFGANYFNQVFHDFNNSFNKPSQTF